jgi:hypothetical protein
MSVWKRSQSADCLPELADDAARRINPAAIGKRDRVLTA